MASRSRLLIRGTALRIFNLTASIGVAFYMIPFLIDALGQRYYGMWGLIGTIIAYLGVMDLGLSRAAQNFIARALGRQSMEDANQVLSTAFWVYVLLGLVAFGVAIIVSSMAPIFLEDTSDLKMFRIAVVVLGVNAAIAFPVMAFNGFFTANLRYDVVAIIALARLVVRSALIIVVAMQGYSIIGIAVTVTVVDIVTSASRLFILKWMFKDIRLSRSLFDVSLIRQLYTYGGKASVNDLANILRFQVDVLVIGAWIDLSAVAVYSVSAQLTERFRQLVSLIFGVTVPVYAQLSESKDAREMTQFFTFSSKLAIVLVVFLAGNAIVYGENFFDIWLGQDFKDAYPVLVILVIGSAIHVSQEPALSLLYGLGEHGRYAAVSAFEGLLNVSLSIWLVQSIGLVGVAIATSVSIFLTAGFAFWCVSNRLKLSMSKQALIYVTVLLTGALVHGAAFLLVKEVNPTGYVALFSLAAVTAPLQVIVLWRLSFTGSEREMIIATMRRPRTASPS